MSAGSGDRRGMIAKVHVAKKQLALQDDSYRSLLLRVTGIESLAAMTHIQLDLVLAEFKKLGFRAVGRISDKPHVRRVFAEWQAMRNHVRDPSKAALRQFVHRQTGLSDPEFLDPAQANKVIEGLKAWHRRERDKQARAAEDAHA